MKRPWPLAAYEKAWRETGMLTQEVTSTTDLIDIAIARGEFCRALGLYSSAWDQFVSKVQSAGKVDGAAIREWVTEHHIDVLWMREWAVRAAELVLRQNGTAPVPIDHVLLDATPHPDLITILSALEVIELSFEWQGHEHPPLPIAETRQAFLNRMQDAWNERASAIGADQMSKRRKLADHAEWFVRSHVNSTPYKELAGAKAEGTDETTIGKAVKRFQTLIQL